MLFGTEKSQCSPIDFHSFEKKQYDCDAADDGEASEESHGISDQAELGLPSFKFEFFLGLLGY